MPARALKPAVLERTYRGTKFVLEEVDTDTYDEIIKKATSQVENPITGRDEDETDENLALRLLMRECVKQPKITDWQGLGTRLTRQLERDVKELHFGLEPTDKKDDKRKKAFADAGEDDDSPNDEG